MLQKIVSLVLAGLLCIKFAYSQNTNFSFTNKLLSDPELPNYGRGAQYWNGTSWDNGGAPQVPNGTGTSGAKTFYRRYWWTECEGAQGVYKFSKSSQAPNEWWKSVEAGLEWCANNGALFSFGGVMTSYDGQDGVYYDGAWSVYPQYLHNLMQVETNTKDWIFTGGNCWIPNWNSPSYLARWRTLNDTLLKYVLNWKMTPSSGPWAGKLVEGKKIIDFIDMRGYGNFGEWHTWPWTQNQPTNAVCTDSSMKKIIDIAVDIYGDYPLHVPIGIFDDNGWSESNAFRTWYVLTRKTRYGVVGWRRDNIGDKGYDSYLIGNTWTGPNGWKADTAISNRWKYAMITGEPLNGSSSYNCCPIYFHIRPEIESYHYAGFGNGNYGVNTTAAYDTIREVFKLTGYRFNLNGGYMNTVLAQNANFDVALNWRNVGASPIYQKRWRVVYQLKTAADVEVKKWTSKFNPYLFLPNTSDSIVSETFNVGNVPIGTTYKLTVKIEDTVGFLSPLYLAINSPIRNSDGSYTLRSNITVATALPVNWYDFRVNKRDTYNQLEWIVSCEKTNDRFEVERSTDGTNFKTITVIKNRDSACDKQTYEYTDLDIFGGSVYYRIAQVDIDGYRSYSKICSLTREVPGLFKVFPNPTDNVLNITLNNNYIGSTVIQLFAVDGKLVKVKPIYKIGYMINSSLDLADLAAGMYFLKIKTEGKLVGTAKVRKN